MNKPNPAELEQKLRNITVDANGKGLSPQVISYLMNLISEEVAKAIKYNNSTDKFYDDNPEYRVSPQPKQKDAQQ